jgi:Fe-Mn family superoxide dismutase
MFNLPKLAYPYEALEPYIDTKTMELHYSKHHQTYVDKLNEAIAKHPELADKKLDDLLAGLKDVPEDIRTAVRNHGGGHYNHSHFWNFMAPKEAGASEVGDELGRAITDTFGKFDDFKQQFNDAAAKVFGSGWIWLVVDETGKLAIKSMPLQDAPVMMGWKPVLGLDVWEHAYYLKYQNKRPDYIAAWWNVVNWKTAEEMCKAAMNNQG